MKVYNFLAKSIFGQCIVLNPIGITIRPLNISEKSIILEELDAIYFSTKSKNMNSKLYKLENDYKDQSAKLLFQLEQKNKFLKYYSKLEDLQKTSYFYYQKIVEANITFNRNYVKDYLNHIVVVEVDEEKLKDYIDNSDEGKRTFAAKILKFILLTEGAKYNNLGLIDSILEDNIHGLFVRLFNITDDGQPLLEKVDIKPLGADKISKFIDKIGSEDEKHSETSALRNFIILIDMLFVRNITIEMEVINYVSIIERILVYGKGDKQSQFVLKLGLCIHDYVDLDNIKLSALLNVCYCVRSDLVHGNEKDLLDQQIKLENIIEYKQICNQVGLDINKVYGKRRAILFYISFVLYSYLEFLLNFWTNNYDRVKFLKNN